MQGLALRMIGGSTCNVSVRLGLYDFRSYNLACKRPSAREPRTLRLFSLSALARRRRETTIKQFCWRFVGVVDVGCEGTLSSCSLVSRLCCGIEY